MGYLQPLVLAGLINFELRLTLAHERIFSVYVDMFGVDWESVLV